MEYYNSLPEIKKNVFQWVLSIFEKTYYLTTDSRQIKKDCIFLAIKGERVDGNSFANKALEQGAALVVMDNEQYLVKDKIDKCLLVDNTERFLQSFASFYAQKLKPRTKFLAISGTNGKTTTKELITSVLATSFNVISTRGNLNNQLGVPLTVLSIKPMTDIAIIEMGASHVGDIDMLCNIVKPDFGILTNIGTAHIQGFGSKENIVATKTELLRSVSANCGYCFINKDDKNILTHKPINSITYSLNSSADMTATVINNNTAFACLSFENMDICSHLIGKYNCYNILAAITIGRFFGVDNTSIKKAIESYIPTNNRSEQKKTANNTLILDCYNANPSSCKEALSAFDQMDYKDKRVFIGQMQELGSVSRTEHQNIATQIKNMHLKQIIFVGLEYKEFAFGDNVLWFASSEEAKDYLTNNQIKDSLIFIKGSRATKMEILADVL